MKFLLRPAIALLATFTFSLAAVPDDIRQNLDKLVPEIIRLLEAKDYATVLETLVPPVEFKKMTAEMSLAQFAEKFGKDHAANLLAGLKALKDQKPKISEDGNKATIGPDDTESSGKSMVFMRIEGRWYLN